MVLHACACNERPPETRPGTPARTRRPLALPSSSACWSSVPCRVSELGRRSGSRSRAPLATYQALTSAGASSPRRDGKACRGAGPLDDDVVRTLVSWMTAGAGATAAIAAPAAHDPARTTRSRVPPRRDRRRRRPHGPSQRTHSRSGPFWYTCARADRAPSMDSLPAARRALGISCCDPHSAFERRRGYALRCNEHRLQLHSPPRG